MQVQVIISPAGEEMIVIGKADFDALLDRIEDGSDVAIYDARKAEMKDNERLSAEAPPRVKDGD